jgi:signal transduction histidine kinase
MLSHQSEVLELAGDALFELQNFLYQGEGGQELSLSSQWWIAELRSYGNRIFEPKGVEFSVAARGELPARVSRYPALSLFRLVREALSNALRHAHPKRVQLIVDWGPPFRLRVIDDGSGRQGQVEGRGLKGMQSRLAELGGEFRCGQPPGGGTGFEVEVMLPKGLESS